MSRAEYVRQWRLNNPDKVAAGIARSADRRKKRWDEFLAAERQRYQENKDAKLAAQKERIEKDPERRREIVRKSYEKNRHKFVARVARRRSAKIQATPLWADFDAIEKIYAEARRLSDETGVPHEVDHIYPLRGKNVCGLHVHTNLRIVTRRINRSKGNKIA